MNFFFKNIYKLKNKQTKSGIKNLKKWLSFSLFVFAGKLKGKLLIRKT